MFHTRMHLYVEKNIHFKQGSLEILKRKECYRPKYSQFQDTDIYMQKKQQLEYLFFKT